MEEKFNIRFNMSYKEIMKWYDFLKTEEEKKQYLEYLKNRGTNEENLTEDGFFVTDKMLKQPDNFLDFKKWREEKSAELNKKSLSQKEIYKLKWNCEAKYVEGLFNSLKESGHVKNTSKILLNNHFSYQNVKPVLMKIGVTKIIWLKGPVELIWFLYYLNQKKIIESPEGKVHFSGEEHFCNSKLMEYKNRTLLQNLTNKLNYTKSEKDKKEPHFPILSKIIEENFPNMKNT